MKNVMSTGDVAELFGVNVKTVIRWADEGKLRYFRTPGGHRRYRAEDVRPFLEIDQDAEQAAEEGS